MAKKIILVDDVTGATEGIDVVSVANGGTEITSYTQGDILYGNSSGKLSKLAAGTAGYVLQTNGSGQDPTWVAQSGGGGSGTVTSITLAASTTGLTISGGATQTITTSGTFTLGGVLVAANGGTGLGAPAAGDAGKVLAAKADGTYELISAALGSIPSDFYLNTSGTYINGEIAFRLVAARDITLASSGHYCRALVGPADAGGAVVKLKISGGADLLTATFAQNATTATIVVNNTAITAGDEVHLVMPATADTALASVYLTAKGTAT